MINTSDLKKTLQQVFKYDNFKQYQLDGIIKVLNNENIYVIMPTGFGKSLLY